MYLVLRGICSVLAIQMVSSGLGFAQSIRRLIITVDICITTRMKKLERVCLLAEALAERKLLHQTTSISQLTFAKMGWKELCACLMQKFRSLKSGTPS